MIWFFPKLGHPCTELIGLLDEKVQCGILLTGRDKPGGGGVGVGIPEKKELNGIGICDIMME